MAGLNKAVFLDRDGTLIEDRDYLNTIEQVQVIPGTTAALRALQEAGYLLFIVTNQSGVGRGYFTLKDVDTIHAHLRMLFELEGVTFQKIYIAPEHPDEPSRGRKPSPQFLFDARDEFNLDLASSYMIGDKYIDLECGWNAGVRKSILVRTGYGLRVEGEGKRDLAQAVICDDLVAASEWILNADRT